MTRLYIIYTLSACKCYLINSENYIYNTMRMILLFGVWEDRKKNRSQVEEYEIQLIVTIFRQIMHS